MERGGRELLSLSTYAFERTRRRLEGLTDEEYLWEPVPACWSVRRHPDGRHRADNAVWPEAPPFTTIAWRLWHLTACYGQSKNARWLGVDIDLPGRFEMDAEAPATAGEALRCVEDAHGHWRSLLEALSEAQLDERLGEIGAGFAERSKASYVLHMLDEFIHHGAELGVLRDLYRAQNDAAHDPLVTALLAADRLVVDALMDESPDRLDAVRAEQPELLVRAVRNGHWRAVPLLLELGFPIDGTPDDVIGATPLHYAAGAGDVDVVRLLIEHGADRHARDGRFDADARGWAEYYGRQEVLDYLASLP